MEPHNASAAIRYSPDAPNPNLHDLTPDFKQKNNSAFFAEVRTRLDALGRNDPRFSHGGRAAVGLIGEYGLIGMTVRNAQRIIRLDRQPSSWSHAFLFYDPISADPAVNRSPRRSPWIWESSLEPSDRFRKIVAWDGVGPRRLSDYHQARFRLFNAHSVPNVAVIVFGLQDDERKRVLDRADNPNVDQLRYDLLGVLGTWYAYITNQASQPNPLALGNAIYCSAYVQLAYEAAGIDLALGAHQHNTSPEHIWQTARYFSVPYEKQGNPVHGWFCVRDPYGGLLPANTKVPKGIRNILREAGGPD